MSDQEEELSFDSGASSDAGEAMLDESGSEEDEEKISRDLADDAYSGLPPVLHDVDSMMSRAAAALSLSDHTAANAKTSLGVFEGRAHPKVGVARLEDLDRKWEHVREGEDMTPEQRIQARKEIIRQALAFKAAVDHASLLVQM